MKTKRSVRIILFSAVLLLALLLLASQGQAANDTLKVSHINVGQGDSFLLQDSDGYTVLIDGGDVCAGPTVVAYLRSHAVDDIDVLVNSHPDPDHVGGLVSVLQATDIPVKAVVWSGYPGTTGPWKAFETAVAEKGLKLTQAYYPEKFTWGDLKVQVLNPEKGLGGTTTNDKSVVLLVRHGSVKFLFTGDIDSAQEAKIIALGTPIAADILKVGHHGSDGSTSAKFLAKVAPTDAVISVAYGNPYGFPGADTIARLKAAGVRIWTTEMNGTVVVISNGVTYSIQGEMKFFYLPVVMDQAFPGFEASRLSLSSASTPTPGGTPTVKPDGTG